MDWRFLNPKLSTLTDVFANAKFTECDKKCGGGHRHRTDRNGNVQEIDCNTHTCDKGLLKFLFRIFICYYMCARYYIWLYLY